MTVVLLVVLAVLGGVASSAAGQGEVPVVARALPDTVTVGEPFVAVARLGLPAGARAELLAVEPADTSAVQGAGQARLHPPDPGRGRAEPLAAVPLVAWRTGRLPAVEAVLRVSAADGGARTVRVRLAMPFVRSTLPADTAGVRPRGPKGVLDPPRDWRVLALLVAAALLAGLLLFLAVRALARRLRRPRAGRPADARAAALAALERARASGLAGRGEWNGFYAMVAEALRGFVAALGPRWGAELTTAELAARMAEDGVAADEVEALASVLASADLAKFARFTFAPEEAAGDLDAARAWVERFQPPAPGAEPDGDVAAGEDADRDADGRRRAAEEVAR